MEKTKSPCGPMEAASRDETTEFVEDDPLCVALDNLCMLLNSWYATMHNPWQREDRAYRREVAERLHTQLRLAVMDEADLEARYREASQQSQPAQSSKSA